MIKIKKILCPVDFSDCSAKALQNALLLAGTYKAELTVFHAVLVFEDETYQPDERLPDFNESYKILSEISDRKLNQLIKGEGNGFRIKKVTRRGFSASEEILSYVQEHGFDLIVMGTHGRNVISHLLLGSVAEKVVRLAPCPVLTITADAKSISKSKNILVPMDFSDFSKTALNYALEIASQYDAQVTLFHVVEQQIHPSFYASGASSIFEIDTQLKQRVISAMKKCCRDLDYATVTTDYEVVEGRPAHEIVEYTKHKNIDLVVIATHGLTGLEHYIWGSTTEKVVRSARVPVLTVKSNK